MDDLVKRLLLNTPVITQEHMDAATELMPKAAARIEALEAERDEARRRRDEWRKKAEGYDAVRKALREKVGAPWPPNLSRALWAGLAADEKKRADDAEAENAKLKEAIWNACCEMEQITFADLKKNPLACLEVIERLDGDLSVALGEWRPDRAALGEKRDG